MRLVKLSAHRFQCIEEAIVEFGPGLNVLFGPNDLGKSSLAWAIRSVLLLQHSSSHHERFVSWYGNEQPRVSLTFTDPQNRYWKVTKTFGGSSGRSLLETSKDGRSFSTDANGRQVDEKLRKLLGWGLAAPGGTGGGRGFPDSFLAQVLLSEQDNVRKVLFDTSLTSDSDESGRRRLTEALGALAQDPLFKKVLDEAQQYVDRAFTGTGRRKRAAGSPFIETAERIKSLQQEVEALDAKVRETQAAELRIQELIKQRDQSSRDLKSAQAELARMEAARSVVVQRAALRARIAASEQRLQEAHGLQREIAKTEQEHRLLQDRTQQATRKLEELTALEGTLATAVQEARTQLDRLVIDERKDAKQAEIEAELQDLRDRVQAARHSLEHLRQREADARAAASSFAKAIAELADATDADKRAALAQSQATEALAQASTVLDQSKDRLRDATSADHAQARELRRTELEYQRLERSAEKQAALGTQQQLQELRGAETRIQQLASALETRTAEAARAAAAVGTAETALAENDTNEKVLRFLQTYAQLQGAREALASRTAAVEENDKERARIAAMREEARHLRGTVRTDLPTATRATELRRLAEDLRVAEARLGGGLSVSIRPRRELALRVSLDREIAQSSHDNQEHSFSAERSVMLGVEDLVDIEITAGEEAARTAARDLRTRWHAEGESTLRALALRDLDELDAAIAAAESARRKLLETDREVGERERQLAERVKDDTAELHERVRELEAALEGADQASLAEYLAKLGSTWPKQLQQGLAHVESERAKLQKTLDVQRAQHARLETQLEADRNTLDAARAELARLQSTFGGDPDEMARSVAASLAAIDQALKDIDAQLRALGGADAGVAAVREQVASAERAVALAKQAHDQKVAAAASARESLIQVRARHEAATLRARDLDTDRVWEGALQRNSALELTAWTSAVQRAEKMHLDLQAQVSRLQSSLQELAKARAEAVHAARTRLQLAEHRAAQTQRGITEARDEQQTSQQQGTEKLLAIADLRTKLARLNVESATSEVASFYRELAQLPGDDAVTEASVASTRSVTEGLQTSLAECEEELARARGALEQVGGAIVREQKRELEQAIARETRREHEIEVEFDAWKLLVETMRETESTEGAHLGRALAGPVSERFRQLTRGRYGNLELGAHLEGAGLQVVGETRDFSALSAGTQDQLATLLRLCVAEQLRTAIVLDDHLSQSDPARVSWFNSILRAAAHKIQIIFITCRPGELLSPAEMPAAAEAMRISAADHVRAIDLTKVIRRFAPETPASTLSAPNLGAEGVGASPFITHDR